LWKSLKHIDSFIGELAIEQVHMGTLQPYIERRRKDGVKSHLVRKAGHTHQAARTGAVTLIQRFGGALNLNIHLHMLFLDGVYVERPDGAVRFRSVRAPTSAELTHLAHIRLNS
jgi:hypothetical protein